MLSGPIPSHPFSLIFPSSLPFSPYSLSHHFSPLHLPLYPPFLTPGKLRFMKGRQPTSKKHRPKQKHSLRKQVRKTIYTICPSLTRSLRGPAAILFVSRNTCSDSIAKLFRACFYGVSHNYRAICCKMGYRTDVPV